MWRIQRNVYHNQTSRKLSMLVSDWPDLLIPVSDMLIISPHTSYWGFMRKKLLSRNIVSQLLEQGTLSDTEKIYLSLKISYDIQWRMNMWNVNLWTNSANCMNNLVIAIHIFSSLTWCYRTGARVSLIFYHRCGRYINEDTFQSTAILRYCTYIKIHAW